MDLLLFNADGNLPHFLAQMHDYHFQGGMV
jgi:hypothetical protein